MCSYRGVKGQEESLDVTLTTWGLEEEEIHLGICTVKPVPLWCQMNSTTCNADMVLHRKAKIRRIAEQLQFQQSPSFIRF